MNVRIRFLGGALLLAIAMVLATLRSNADDKTPTAGKGTRSTISVLLITGQNNHDWEFTSKFVEKMLERTKRFDVTITTDPSRTLAEDDLSKYDVFFLDYNGKSWSEAARKKFEAAVQSGTGVTIMHAANNAFPGWKEYESLCALCWRKGTGHGRFHPFDVDIVDKDHPITKGMKAMKVHPDELYHKLVHMHDAKYHLLMQAHSAKESGGTGNDEPMAIVLEHGKGRVFHTPLGHVWRKQANTHASLEDPQLQLLLARGTEWAATGKCTIAKSAFHAVQ